MPISINNFRKNLLRISILPLFFSLLLLPQTAYASTINDPNMVKDNFSDWEYQDEWFFGDPVENYGDPYWWVNHISDNNASYYNVPCTPSGNECLTHETENGDGFMRLSVKPFDPVSELTYHVVALDEINQNWTPLSEPLRWEPDPGHPIVVKATVRWSDVYNADGTGDFLGSSGIVLWNMPFNFNEFKPVKGILFQVLSDDSSLERVVGFQALVFDQETIFDTVDDSIVYSQELHDVDINDWVELKIKWIEENNGVQKVKFFVDGDEVGEHTLNGQYPPLDLEAWNDNYVVTPTQIGFGEFTVDQDFDISKVVVKKE